MNLFIYILINICNIICNNNKLLFIIKSGSFKCLSVGNLTFTYHSDGIQEQNTFQFQIIKELFHILLRSIIYRFPTKSFFFLINENIVNLLY
jgi:hypothetical protein